MGKVLAIPTRQGPLNVEILGQGDLVVFLHAAVCDGRMWRGVYERLGADHCAIRYDRPGHGVTPAATQPYSSVAQLVDLVESLSGGDPVTLVGCSQGGRIALDTALKHPHLVGRLCLIAPTVSGAPAPVYPPQIEALLGTLETAQAAGDLDRQNHLKAHLWLDGPLAAEHRVTGASRRLFLEMNALALRSASQPPDTDGDQSQAFHRLDQIRVPTMVIWGDLDFPHIQTRSRHVAATVPLGEHRVLNGVAHLPSLEQPGTVARHLEQFVDGLASGDLSPSSAPSPPDADAP